MPSLLSVVLLPRLLMRKKFFIRCGRWVPLVAFPEEWVKVRFSDTVEVLDDWPKNCVMVAIWFYNEGRLKK